MEGMMKVAGIIIGSISFAIFYLGVYGEFGYDNKADRIVIASLITTILGYGAWLHF